MAFKLSNQSTNTGGFRIIFKGLLCNYWNSHWKLNLVVFLIFHANFKVSFPIRELRIFFGWKVTLNLINLMNLFNFVHGLLKTTWKHWECILFTLENGAIFIFGVKLTGNNFCFDLFYVTVVNWSLNWCHFGI